MSALGFLGGLAGFANSFQKGYEQSEDREQLKKDRDFQRQQREFEQGQQNRKLDEQKRADDVRASDSSVATTEEIDDPNWKPEPASASPVAQVVVGEDGSETVTPAQAPQQAPKIKRQRQWDSIYRDYAANRRKAGDVAGALDFESKAIKVTADNLSREASSLIGRSDSMTFPEFANAAASTFTNDSSPFVIDGAPIQNKDGTITMNVKNTTNGKTMPATFKDKAHLSTALRSMYQPEQYAKLLERKAESDLKYREELLKPYTLRSGERRQVMGPDGKVQTLGENPTDRVQIGEDAEGNPIYGKPSKYLRGTGQGGTGGDGDGEGGTGSKKKGKTPLDIATSSVMDAIKESAESKTLNADQLIGVQATARELVANAVRNKKELDPYVAGKVALTAVLKPESVKIGYNPATGTFENTVKYNGNEFSVGKVDQATMPESQLKGVAQTFVSKLPADSRADYIKAAAGDKAALDKFNADVVAANGKQWAERFTAANGRKPTQQDVQDSIARTQSVVSQNIQLVAASGAVEQDKKQRDAATRKQSEATAKAAIGTPDQIMALPPGKAAEIYRQYGGQTDAFQREALQMKMQQDRRNMSVGGMRQQ